MTDWPKQSECDAFYGDPRGTNGQPSPKWMRANLIQLPVPFKMTYAGKAVSTILIHRKCADSLKRVLEDIWRQAGQRQAVVDSWGMSVYGGAFNYRLMRGGSKLSMHAYGCAVDFDPARNGLGDSTPYFRNVPQVLNAFAIEGWTWGGNWSRPDGMHFQAARV